MRIIFVPVTVYFSEKEYDYSENCSISTLGLLPPTSASKASLCIDIFVLDRRNTVLTNMCSSLLFIASSVQAINLFGCKGVSPQNSIVYAKFLASSNTFLVTCKSASGSLLHTIRGPKRSQRCSQIYCS